MKALWQTGKVPVYEHGGYIASGERTCEKVTHWATVKRAVCPHCQRPLTRGVENRWYCYDCNQFYEEP